jgi:sugar/nucleoside kinase (ribokinase family)
MAEYGKSELKAALTAKKGAKLRMVVGVDGFVDEIIHVVAKRKDFSSFTRVETIEDFGKRILNAAGLSTNIELVTAQTKLGGNGPILANALLEYGANLTYVGALGNPIHPVFQPLAEKAENAFAIGEPGHTDALEFSDGKLMLGKHAYLGRIRWEGFKNALGGIEKTIELIGSSDLIGMVNWTMIPHMNEIWKGILEEVLPKTTEGSRPVAFFDLADPEKRTKEDIKEAMDLIGEYTKHTKTILGLNKKELYEIAEVVGVPASGLEQTTKDVYGKLGIYCLVVHPTKEACCVADGEYYHVDGPYCANPILTTGAGDNFNAGFCLGQALGIDPGNSLLLGVSTSGYYVRNAKSPTYDDVIKFVGDWQDGNI